MLLNPGVGERIDCGVVGGRVLREYTSSTQMSWRADSNYFAAGMGVLFFFAEAAVLCFSQCIVKSPDSLCSSRLFAWYSWTKEKKGGQES